MNYTKILIIFSVSGVIGDKFSLHFFNSNFLYRSGVTNIMTKTPGILKITNR